MKNADFEHSPSGYLVPTVYDQRAFMPKPLPPQIDLGKVALSLSEISVFWSTCCWKHLLYRFSDVVNRIGITDAAARNLLRQLTEIDVLREAALYYPTAWIAAELIEVSRP